MTWRIKAPDKFGTACIATMFFRNSLISACSLSLAGVVLGFDDEGVMAETGAEGEGELDEDEGLSGWGSEDEVEGVSGWGSHVDGLISEDSVDEADVEAVVVVLVTVAVGLGLNPKNDSFCFKTFCFWISTFSFRSLIACWRSSLPCLKGSQNNSFTFLSTSFPLSSG